DMVRGWLDGASDVPADAEWQPELFRQLRTKIGSPSPAERRDAACERLRSEPGLVDLPPRLALFGLTRLPAGHLQVLRALAEHRDVHLFLLRPSPTLWNDGGQDPQNRLLASWGRDS